MKLSFGYARDAWAANQKERMGRFAALVGEIAHLEIAARSFAGYQELTYAMSGAKVDLAWLPPIPFLALERRGSIVPLVSPWRSGSSSFHSVLVVHTSSKIRSPSSLAGKRAAWVDVHSAAGYVLPRIELAALGVDPRKAFAAERFWSSHAAVARAVIEKAADFGATYAGYKDRTLARAPWIDIPDGESSIRVLAAFGEIPADVIAARADVPQPVRDKAARALLSASQDRGNRLLLADLFGADELRRWQPAGYEALRGAVMDASAAGLLEGEERG